MAKSTGTHGEGRRPSSSPKHGLKQIRKAPARVEGQQHQPVSRGSNGVIEQGSYAGVTMTKLGTLAPSLLDGNTPRRPKIGTTGLPDAPNPGNMGEGGVDIPGGGTFQNKNFPVGSVAHNFKGSNKSSEPGGGNKGPVQDMRSIADRANKLVHGSPTNFSKTIGESDSAGPKPDFVGEVTGVLRAKAEDMPYKLAKSYEKKGQHGTSVNVESMGGAKVPRRLEAA